MTDPIIPMILIGMFVALDLVLLRHVCRKEKADELDIKRKAVQKELEK